MSLPPILISFYKDLALYQDGCLSTFDRQDTYFGITNSEEEIFVANRSYIIVFDRFLKRKRNLYLLGILVDNPDIHQILYKGEHIYGTYTAGNSIFKVDSEGKNTDRFFIEDKSKMHLNSIFEKDGCVYLCAMHGSDDGMSNLYKLNESLEVVKIHKNVGEHCHNIYVDEWDNIYYLRSSEGVVIGIDQEGVEIFNRDLREEFGLKEKMTWLRGLAKTENNFIIGCSYAGSRSDRINNNSYLLIADNDFNPIKKIKLDIGSIQDLRILNEPDHAHNKIICKVDKK